MTLPTHLVFSQLVFTSLSAFFDHKVSPSEIIFVSVGSMLPDIDTPHSLIGKVFKPISLLLNKKFSHRTAVHSILFSLPLLLIPKFGHLIFIGFVLHLLLDMSTKTGVMIFYPLNLIAVIPRKDEWRIRTGSIQELFLFIIFSFLLTLSLRMNILGTGWMIHRIVGTTRSVVSEMMNIGDGKNVYVRIEGIFTFSNMEADGIYKVVSRLDENTILVEKNGILYSVGGRRENEINPKRVWIEKVEDAKYKSVKVDLTGLDVSDLKKIPGRMYGSGILLYPSNLQDPMVQFPTIQGSGRKVKIVWAKGEDFEVLGRNLFVGGSVVVRYEGEEFDIPRYSDVRVYEMDLGFGDMVKVHEGMRVKRGDVLIDRGYRRERLDERIEEKENELRKLVEIPELESIGFEEMEGYRRSVGERRKKIVREIEKLVNEKLKMNDVVAEEDGIVKMVDWDDGKIVVAEW